MSNTRRRFLGLLALLGVPALARAQTPAVEVTCKKVLLNTPKVYHSYYRNYDLGDGKLTPKAFGDYSYVLATPTKTQFSDGFSDAAGSAAASSSSSSSDSSASPDDSVIASDAIQFKIWDPSSDGFSGSFSASIRAPGQITQCGVVLVTSAGQLFATGGGFPVSETDPNVYNISASWDPTPAQVLQGPIQVGIYFNNAVNAIIDFDLSVHKVLELSKAMDDDLQSKSGLAVDPTTNLVTGAEVCHYEPEPDYSGYSGAAPCFFTTATVETLGLSDDCWELRTLRAFRDGPLALTVQGRALTARYYAEAPRLVDGVNRRTDAARMWLRAYWTHILPCAVLARLGFTGSALAHYKRLFVRLEKLAA